MVCCDLKKVLSCGVSAVLMANVMNSVSADDLIPSNSHNETIAVVSLPKEGDLEKKTGKYKEILSRSVKVAGGVAVSATAAYGLYSIGKQIYEKHNKQSGLLSKIKKFMNDYVSSSYLAYPLVNLVCFFSNYIPLLKETIIRRDYLSEWEGYY